MSQDPNAKVGIDASEIGANAAETGDRDLSHHDADVVDDHEVVHEPLDFHELAEQGHAATALDLDAEPIITVDNLKMYFPVKSGGLIRRTVGHVQPLADTGEVGDTAPGKD